MTVKTKQLHIAAATIVKEVGGKEFVNHPGRPPAMQRNLLHTLCDVLTQETNCADRTARRHIRAALGLIDPIGARAMRTPLPVQSINFRATKAEKEAIGPAVRAKINALLAKSRATQKMPEGIDNEIPI